MKCRFKEPGFMKPGFKELGFKEPELKKTWVKVVLKLDFYKKPRFLRNLGLRNCILGAWIQQTAFGVIPKCTWK